MSISTEGRIEEWLRPALFAGRWPHRLVLVQQLPMGGQTVQEWIIKSDPSEYDDSSIIDWCTNIANRCQEVANGYPKRQSFVLLTFDEQNHQTASSGPFRFSPEQDEYAANVLDEMSPGGMVLSPGGGMAGMGMGGMGDSMESFPMAGHPQAPAAQIVSGLLSHNAAMFRITTQTMTTMLASQNSIIERQQTHIERMERTHLDGIKRREELETQAHERKTITETAAREEERRTREEKRREEMWAKLVPMIPTVLAKLDFSSIGKLFAAVAGIEPQAIGKAEEECFDAVRVALDSLSPDQMKQLIALLGTNSLPLFDLYEQVKRDGHPANKRLLLDGLVETMRMFEGDGNVVEQLMSLGVDADKLFAMYSKLESYRLSREKDNKEKTQ
jgi:hypothetical protein